MLVLFNVQVQGINITDLLHDRHKCPIKTLISHQFLTRLNIFLNLREHFAFDIDFIGFYGSVDGLFAI